ncbi:c-type cytochrome [Thiohalobacter sp. IOR34]|uniref:c-type cytochrome n=1 Tax=Thiohalobacter sp. IOR34 TaxID=3057176 RepID=UPI0025AEDE6C|nr:c-type cytochrome [Thiohalobacter sp. IOR34]WJW75462.1 c-type cytochrome [Thiohalobacter sp. IOR34]
MNKQLVFAAVMTLSAAFAASSAMAADAAAGKEKAAMCASCHGADGNSVNPEWPKLAGQHAKYLAKQLADFKAGRRSNALMAPMAVGLSPQDMENVAAFFASQAKKLGEADPKLVDLGEKIYRGGNKTTGVAACMACHAPNGAGNPAANFPALAGQHAKYVENQLKAFRDGSRSNDAGKMMRGVAARMTDEEIAAVASYVQGLR